MQQYIGTESEKRDPDLRQVHNSPLIPMGRNWAGESEASGCWGPRGRCGWGYGESAPIGEKFIQGQNMFFLLSFFDEANCILGLYLSISFYLTSWLLHKHSKS
jgi:hypothetical protein